MEFRAEGFNIFNHHNFYVNPLVSSQSRISVARV